MRIKEDRLLAKIVLAVVVAASIFLGGGVKLAGERAEAEKVFYAASESVSAELKELSKNAYLMLGIAREYDAANADYIAALDGAIARLDAAEAIADKSAARAELNKAVEDAYTDAASLKMSQTHADDLRYAYKNFSSANLRIAHDAYNDAAEEFNRLRAGFPAKLIAAARGVKELDKFE